MPGSAPRRPEPARCTAHIRHLPITELEHRKATEARGEPCRAPVWKGSLCWVHLKMKEAGR